MGKKNLSQSVLSLSGIIKETISDAATDAGKTAVENAISKGLKFGLSAGLTKLSSAFPPAAIVTVAGALATSCLSQYYAFQNTKLDAEFRRGLTQDILKIEQAEHEQYTSLQARLLDSSWRLLRQYHLPDEYRIVQSGVDDLFRAVNETDTAKSRAMLVALEDEFNVYPPYWVYRARVAENVKEAAKCFDEFNKVWRPVLRNDVWKAEAEKFRVLEALNSGDKSAAMNHLEAFCANIERSDWTGNLFAGVVYYMLGEKEKGTARVELNVNFGAEKEISGAVVRQMKEGRLDFGKLPEDLRKIAGLSSMRLGTVKMLAMNGDIEAQLTLGRIYTDGGITFGLGKIYEEGKITSKDYAVALGLYGSTKKGGKNDRDNVTAEISEDGGTAKFTFGKNEYTLKRIVAIDYAEAVKWYKNAAYEGSKAGADGSAHLYFTGGHGLSQSYYDAYVWCCVADMTNDSSRWLADVGVIAAGAIVGGGVSAVLETVAVGTGLGAIGVAGVSALAFAPVAVAAIPVAVMSYFLFDSDISIKEEIEGVGLFNLAKLSSSEMDKAKIEAGKIMAEIERNIKHRQQTGQ